MSDHFATLWSKGLSTIQRQQNQSFKKPVREYTSLARMNFLRLSVLGLWKTLRSIRPNEYQIWCKGYLIFLGGIESYQWYERG